MKVIALVLSLSLAGGPLAAQQAVFRGRGDAVVVDVSVTNGKTPVAGLKAADFELLDNGVRQVILDAGAESLPIDASILLDVSGSVRKAYGDGLASAAAQTKALFNERDRSEVILFGSAIRQASVWHGQPLGSWAGIHGNDRGTALFDALLVGLVRPAELGYRRLIVVFTDGTDTASLTSRSVRLAVLDRSDAVVHIVIAGASTAVFELSGHGEPSQVGDLTYLASEIAARSGGRFFDLSGGRTFLGGLRAATEEFRTRYVLRYTPQSADSPGWHDIVVRVKGKDYEIRARRGYVRD